VAGLQFLIGSADAQKKGKDQKTKAKSFSPGYTKAGAARAAGKTEEAKGNPTEEFFAEPRSDTQYAPRASVCPLWVEA
jgi:hypothetical protein